MSMPHETRAPRWLVPTLSVLLFGSGLCALVYQVLWLRLLALTFGVTVHAAATVLASFMGGLALGSLLAGRLADRSRAPLRLFGIVELLIGACALATPVALGALQTCMAAAAPSLPDSPVVMTLVRLVGSFGVLLVPTALMGATLPIVVRSSLAKLDGLGSHISVLYGFNTAGAIAGALAAGLVLLPRVGMTRSFLLAAGLNAAVGATAVVLARWVPQRGTPDAAEEVGAIPEVPVLSVPASWARVLLLVSALSGFASLALEVVWFRLLGIFIGPTAYTFTVVLALVLTGIAAGSFVAALILRWRALDHWQALALVQVVGAGLVLRSFAGLLVPQEAPMWMQAWLNAAGLGFAVPAMAMGLTVVLPASVFFGVAFPIGLKLWTEGRASDVGRRVGVFYAVNVAGGIVGSLLAGFVLLPVLGSRASLIALAGVYVVAGAALQLVVARRRPFMTGVVVVALAVLAMEVRSVPEPLDVMRRRLYVGRQLIWQDEGPQTTVAVAGAVSDRVMFLDGRHQANDSPSMVFVHRRIGLLPAVLHAAPRRALVIGLGGGATPGGLSQYPRLDIDLVELSGGVIEGARYFQHMNFNVLGHPRVTVRVDDGRNFLQRVRVPYDVITADAIIPRHAGANSLNSVEYFRLVRAALAPGGVALHWNGGATHAEHRLILRAFVDVFPHATLWGDGSLMVGTHEPLTVSRQRIERMLAEPDTRHALSLMNVTEVGHLERTFKAGPDAIRRYVEGSPVLSDDQPRLEYFESLPQELLRVGEVSSPSGTVFVP